MKPFQAGPDQVLVLYNADWTRDVDGSEPGQDSREVADHYIRMHTDPDTGKRPHVLGLRCVHGARHLNRWFIDEKSQDNREGIVFVGDGPGPGAGTWARDSRKVEVVIEPGQAGIDWDSVAFHCRPEGADEWTAAAPSVTGVPVREGRRFVYPEVEPDRGRCYRFDAHAFFPGTVEVRVQAKDRAGRKARDMTFTCYDLDDFRFSETGPDRVRDDLHFQEDVALPVKRFLEDPKNALPDGTSLKEHVLYIVLCHGLPWACEGVFGIEHGVTASPRDHGDLASLENRLQTLYYGWGGPIRPPVISMYMSGGPDAGKGVRNHRITSALRRPLIGRSWNPYMHPDTYGFLMSRKPPRPLNPLPLPVFRRRLPGHFFAYGVTRLDGAGPEEAKRQVDYSVYASSHLRPEMDLTVRQGRSPGEGPADLGTRLETAWSENLWGASELEALGFSDPKRHGFPFMARPHEDVPCPGESGEKKRQGYYPGGMDRTVASSNGWNMGRHAGIWRQVDQGVSVSACGGPAYGGGPHITNTTFWDNRILLHYLFRGRDLGECFLLSTCHVNWSTSLLGDPLYHPDLRHTVPDVSPPRVTSPGEVSVRLVPAEDAFAGVIRLSLASGPSSPEVALLSAFYAREGDSEERVSRSVLYSARPSVVMEGLAAESRYTLRLLLRDPYGNETELSGQWAPETIVTPALSDRRQYRRPADLRERGARITAPHRKHYTESGRVCAAFEAGKNGMIPALESPSLAFRTRPWQSDRIQGTLRMGDYERCFFFPSPLEEGEPARMVVRWRRFPLTREVLLMAANGRTFSLAADVRTPWQPFTFRSPLWVTGSKGVHILSAFLESDAQPASSTAQCLAVPAVDPRAWRAANGPPPREASLAPPSK